MADTKQYEGGRKSGMSTGKWIGLIIAVLVVIGLLYYTFQPFQAGEAGEDLIQAQLRSIRNGNLQEAYSYSSWRLQQRNSFEEFKNFIERNPLLKQATGFVVQSSRTDGGVITLKESWKPKVLPMRYKVVTENGFWKIRYMNAGQIPFE